MVQGRLLRVILLLVVSLDVTMTDLATTQPFVLFDDVWTNASTMTPTPPPPTPTTTTLMTPTEDAERIADLNADLQMTRFVVMKILVPVIMSVGVVGNLLSIAVLTRRWMRSSTNYYLTILAVYDVMYLIFAFSLIIKHHVSDVSALHWYNLYKYHVGIPVTNICSNTGVWLTLTFTIERYVGVCYPMKGKALCTPQRAKIIISVVCAVAAIVTFPDFLGMKLRTTYDKTTNRTIYGGEATEIGRRPSYSIGYNYVTQVLFTFMPLVLLVFFNSLLIRAVVMATRQRRSMAQLAVVQSERQERQSRDQHRITVMLIAVVIVFLLCHMPQAVQHIVLAYMNNQGRPSQEQRLLLVITANVFNLFVIINSSINFILYSAFSTKFRRTFARLFCGCLRSRRSKADLFSEAATARTTLPDESRAHLLHTNLLHTNKNGGGHGDVRPKGKHGRNLNGFLTSSSGRQDIVSSV